MLELYYNKQECELKIKKDTKLCYGKKHIEEIKEQEISYFNDCYYIAEERKPLIVKAQEIRNKWIEETKQRLIELENMSYPKR